MNRIKWIRQIDEIFKRYFKEERKLVRYIILFAIFAIYSISCNMIEKQVEYEEYYNDQISLLWSIPILLYIVRTKYIDMKFSEQNDGAVANLMKYSPIETKILQRYYNIKMWVFTVLFAIPLCGINIGTAYRCRGVMNEGVLVICLFEILYCIGVTIVWNRIVNHKSNHGNSTTRKVIGICASVGFISFLYILLNVPKTHIIDQSFYGVVGTLESENIKYTTFEVKGIYKEYLVKEDTFEGIIASEEMRVNVEKEKLNLSFSLVGNGDVVSIPFSGFEFRACLYVEPTFDQMYMEILHIRNKSFVDSIEGEGPIYFAAPAQTLEEAQGIAQYFEEKIRQEREQ